MPKRVLPFSPRSTIKMKLGDLIAIPCDDGACGVLQVSDFRKGPGARTTFGVGVLPWRGPAAPTSADVQGLEFLAHGLTGIEMFTEGGLQIVGNAALCGGMQSNLNDADVGTVHSVWGWMTAVRKAQQAAGSTI